MIIYILLLVVVPGILAMIQYEKIRKKSFTQKENITYSSLFAFIITFINLAFLYIRGWTTLDLSKLYIGYMVKSMALSLILAYIAPYAVYLFQRYITGSIEAKE